MKSIGIDSRESWVIVGACCTVYLLSSLPMRLGAQLFVSVLEQFDANRKAGSAFFALIHFSRCLSGPFAGYFGNKFGLREVTLIGTILCAFGTGCCFFAEDIIFIDAFLGVVYGVGFGWSTALLPEITNQHFISHRAKAFGVVTAGGGLGAFIFPYILDFTLRTYGLIGSFLLLAGLLLNGIPACLLIHKPRTEKTRGQKNDPSTGGQITVGKENISLETVEKLSPFNEKLDIERGKDLPSSKTDTNTESTGFTSICLETQEEKKKDPFKSIANSQGLILNAFSDSFIQLKNLEKSKFPTSLKSEQIKQRNLEDQPILKSYKILAVNSEPVYSIDAKTDHTKLDESNQNPKRKTKSLCDSFSTLLDPVFLVIAFLHSFHFHVMDLWILIMVDVARDKHFETYQEVQFAMVLALSDTIGRGTLGWVTDGGYLSRTNFSALCFLMMALDSVIMPWLGNYFITMANVCVFGIVCGASTTGLAGLVTKFIDEKKRTMAMASRYLLYAPISLTISPLVGYCRGQLGSYDGVYYTATTLAGICFISVLILAAVVKGNDSTREK